MNMNYDTHTHTQQKRCCFCGKNHHGSQRVCRKCIRRHRPKLDWRIFFVFTVFLLIVPGIVYYIYVKEKQKEW